MTGRRQVTPSAQQQQQISRSEMDRVVVGHYRELRGRALLEVSDDEMKRSGGGKVASINT